MLEEQQETRSEKETGRLEAFSDGVKKKDTMWEDLTMETWPELAFEEWKDTRNTLHFWMQVVGKVKLELCPFLKQWWEIVLLLTPSLMQG